MELILVILGAILATGGGFLRQLYQDCQDRKNNDRNVLIKALDTLLRRGAPTAGNILNNTKEKYSSTIELYRLSFELKLKKNRDISDMIRKYTLEKKGKQDLLEALQKRLLSYDKKKKKINEEIKDK